MKKLFLILIPIMLSFGCSKTSQGIDEAMMGDWRFEVTYTNLQQRESVFNCDGEFILKDSKIFIHHCIDGFVEVEIKEDGAVYSSEKNKLIGLVEGGSCIIVDDSPDEKSITRVTIRGEKI